MSTGQAVDVPQEVLDHLEAQKTLTLATASSDGEPHAATLLYVNDGADVFVWFKPNAQTARHIDANPRVSFAIDEYTEDWSKTKGIQASGRCEPVTGEDVARVALLFGEKFPQLSPRGSTASIAFYRLRPEKLQFIDNSGAENKTDEFGIDYRRDEVLG